MTMKTTKLATLVATAILIGALFTMSATTEDPVSTEVEAAPAAATDADALAKKLSNPIAAMISVPFQNNFDWGGGPTGNGFQYKLNFQPVIPFTLNENWNAITRTIIPYIEQENVIGTSNQSGLSDSTFSTWFSPSTPTSSGWTWGVGPAFLLPTGTNSFLSADQWAVGPTAIALRQTKHFTYGALVNQLWAFSGGGNGSSVNQMFVQPFFVYLPGGGWSFALNTENTYNFTSNQWTVPVNLMANKMFKLGKMPAQWQIGVRYYAEAPNNAPDWGLRAGLTFLFPK